MQKPVDPGTLNKMYTRTGYLFCQEKKALGTSWQKCYCQYIRENRYRNLYLGQLSVCFAHPQNQL